MTHALGPDLLAALWFQIPLGLVAGGLLGLLHFATLRWITTLYLGKMAMFALGLQVLRFAVLGLVLFLLARLGAPALLSAALALLAARSFIVRRTGDLP